MTLDIVYQFQNTHMKVFQYVEVNSIENHSIFNHNYIVFYGLLIAFSIFWNYLLYNIYSSDVYRMNIYLYLYLKVHTRQQQSLFEKQISKHKGKSEREWECMCERERELRDWK